MYFERDLCDEEYTRITEKLLKTYDFLTCEKIGRSIEGRELRLFRVGSGKTKYLLVGAHHGSEWITACLALEILQKVCENRKNGQEKYLKSVTLCVLPEINPDGVELCVNGSDARGLLHERRIRMNGGSADFTHWNANARGVDLNHNYNADWAKASRKCAEKGIISGGPTRFGGTFPESEPETFALCRLCERENFDLAVALHSQGREIYYDFNGLEPKISFPLALSLAQKSGYAVAKPEELACGAGFKDWFVAKFGKPALTVECGKGQNPLPLAELPNIVKELENPLISLPLLLKSL